MIKVSNRRIVFTPIFESKMSGSGLLHIPETAQSRCINGIVKYVGDKVRDLKVGDHIFFGAYSGTFINTVDEGMVGILDERFVYGVVSGAEKIQLRHIYLRDKNGEYFNVSYEDLFNIVAMELEGHPEVLISTKDRDVLSKINGRDPSDWMGSNYLDSDDDI